MDSHDRAILEALQSDASLSLQQLAEKVGLSPTPCWNRIRRLEDTGVIRGRVAVLDPQALGLTVTAYVSIETSDHSQAWLARFAEAVMAMPEVVDVYRMMGDVDYMLRVVAPSIEAYDDFYRRLIKAVPLKNVSARIALEQIKATTKLPLALSPAFKIKGKAPERGAPGRTPRLPSRPTK
jgi:Lrp/AsnC family transcriptional regulator